MSDYQPNFTITDPARDYLAQLLQKQDAADTGIRVFVTKPGTPQAETCVAYCKPGEEEQGDVRFDFGPFVAWIDPDSERYLEGAVVDFQENRFGGQLTIKAPNARMPQIDEDSPLSDRVNYVLYNEINPQLAAHGGMVTLHELTEDNTAVLQFGGGCQGCGMVDVTLKEGVERTLKDRIPELSAVVDVTDHSLRENAYYK